MTKPMNRTIDFFVQKVRLHPGDMKADLLKTILAEPDFYCQNPHFLGYLMQSSKVNTLFCEEEIRQKCWTTAVEHTNKVFADSFEKQVDVSLLVTQKNSTNPIESVTNFLVENLDTWLLQELGFDRLKTIQYLLTSRHRYQVAGTPFDGIDQTLRRAMEILSQDDLYVQEDEKAIEKLLALYLLQINFEDDRVDMTLSSMIKALQTCLVDE